MPRSVTSHGPIRLLKELSLIFYLSPPTYTVRSVEVTLYWNLSSLEQLLERFPACRTRQRHLFSVSKIPTPGAEECTAHMLSCTSVHSKPRTRLEYAAYVIPSSVHAHPSVLCLFGLYLVPLPYAIRSHWYHTLRQALSSLLFSGLGSSCPNNDSTDKHKH